MYFLTSTAKKIGFRTPTPLSLKKNKQIITTHLYAAKNILEQGLGLMGRKLKEKEALIFYMKKRQHMNLHMWFVFRPIDVLFCDVTSKGILIQEIKRNFKPFALYKASVQTDLFIELPKEGANQLKKGDYLIPSRKIFKP